MPLSLSISLSTLVVLTIAQWFQWTTLTEGELIIARVSSVAVNRRAVSHCRVSFLQGRNKGYNP